MAEMKVGYKQTDIGVIPEDWDTPFMGDLAQIQRGASPRPISSPIWFDDKSSVGWLRISDVSKSKKYLKETTQHLSEAGIANSRYVAEQNLVMSICATVGRPIITHKNLCIHDGFVVFDQIKADKEYMYYALSNIENDWAKYGQTGSQMNLNTGLINSTRIPLPKPEEQKQIAAALSDVDGLIEALSQLIAKKRDMKTAVMQQLLTGKKRLPGFESTTEYQQTDIGVIPEDWDIKQLGNIGGFAKGSGIKKDEAQSGTLPCVRYGELYTKHHDVIRRFYSFISEEVSKNSKKLKYGDILFACSGETKEEIGKCASFLDKGKAYAGGDIIILSPHSDNAEFLGYLLNSDKIAQQKSSLGQGDAVVHINAKSLASIPIPLPKPEEQKAISQILFDIDIEIDALEQRLAKARSLKTGMMQELLTGKTQFIKTDKKQEAA